jgi:hypothetical protein
LEIQELRVGNVLLYTLCLQKGRMVVVLKSNGYGFISNGDGVTGNGHGVTRQVLRVGNVLLYTLSVV